MHKSISTLILGLLAGTLAFAQSVKTDYDKNISWERYHSFAWRDGKRPATGAVENSIVAGRIHNAFSAELTKRGWVATEASPDVFLSYHLTAKNERNVFRSGPAWGPSYYGRGRYYGGGFGGTTFVNRYVAGSLIVDMVDAHTGNLIWRGYASDDVSHLPDLTTEKKIGKIAEKSFKNFPKHG